MVKNLALAALLTVALAACDSDDNVITIIATQLGAAEDHPCAEQIDNQHELNGVPDDTRSATEQSADVTTVIEQHWYEELQLIVTFNYAQGEQWCESWTESGVNWE